MNKSKKSEYNKKWREKHKDEIKDIYVGQRDKYHNSLLVLIVKKRARLDIEFDDLVSSLDIDVARDKELEKFDIPVNFMALPAGENEDISKYWMSSESLKLSF